jgi:hypothetical protein
MFFNNLYLLSVCKSKFRQHLGNKPFGIFGCYCARGDVQRKAPFPNKVYDGFYNN